MKTVQSTAKIASWENWSKWNILTKNSLKKDEKKSILKAIEDRKEVIDYYWNYGFLNRPYVVAIIQDLRKKNNFVHAIMELSDLFMGKIDLEDAYEDELIYCLQIQVDALEIEFFERTMPEIVKASKKVS
ncbi:MAG: hypothetical protein E7062_02315 [Spirochaetaceae bacterium]|nr:hypothetical protein [Spirochaetaceae bacterium]